jgi:uncharacterized membrane protein YecN with MAPEG domain
MQRLLATDEREQHVGRTGDQLAYVVMSIALLLLVAYRSLFLRESSWDLMGVVLLGGAVATGYRLWQRVCTRRSAMYATLVAVISGVVAMIIVVVAVKLLG